MIYVYSDEKDYINEIQYTFDVLLYILGVEYSFIKSSENLIISNEDILIVYGDYKVLDTGVFKLFRKIIAISASRELFNYKYLKDGSVPDQIQFFELDNQIKNKSNVISIFSNNQDLYINHYVNEKFIISTNIDIISDSFFMLSRYEEVVGTHKDSNLNFGRFSALDSLAYKNNFLCRPIVNEYIELLWEWLHELESKLVRKKWWDKQNFAAIISHDIDSVYKYKPVINIFKLLAKQLIINKSINKFFTTFYDVSKVILGKAVDPYWNFEYITDTIRKFDFNSSFYFMSGGNTKYDNHYNIKGDKFIKFTHSIENLGFEVGYHGSYNSFDNYNIMQSEKDILDNITIKKPFGCRQHYLRFNVPNTWNNQANCKILYDNTLTYAEHEGFRCGICFPFRPFDVFEKKVIDIWEIPLIVMDVTLKNKNYRNLTFIEAEQIIIKLINTVNDYNGVFSILFHNSTLENDNKEWRQLFEKTLDTLSTSRCLAKTGREIIEIFNRELTNNDCGGLI